MASGRFLASSRPHPLQALSKEEFTVARAVVANRHGASTTLLFRSIQLHEPAKEELIPYLVAEHGGRLTDSTPRPRRLAKVQYDVIKSQSEHVYTETVVDVESGEVKRTKEFAKGLQTFYTLSEYVKFQDACVSSNLFKAAMGEFSLPANFAVTIDPWPYGGPDPGEETGRYMQGLVYARDTTSANPDSNHYGYPIPLIPVMDVVAQKIVRVDRAATGGKGDALFPPKFPAPPGASPETPKPLFEHSKPSEYVPELLDRPVRPDVKPIHITQPEGASFAIDSSGLVEWQGWRFRLGFTPREGAVLHDVTYHHRPVLYRLSFSEMTVPYADPRPPYHHKQAFDFGDGGAGRAANSLALGCDCLGAIHYVDTLLPDTDGNPTTLPAVVCLHEQDAGIGWKHTNYRTNRAVATRLRQLVVQFIVTLANYEYVFAFLLDTAAGITVEVRATGIVSTVAIDHGKEPETGYGTVVAPGVLAQNHQHVFALRVDPAVDGYLPGQTRVVVEESVPLPPDPATNPAGNHYDVRREIVARAGWRDAEPRLNRKVRLESLGSGEGDDGRNKISGRRRSYVFTPPATQLMLAAEGSVQAKRAPFAKHHVWVTGYRDGELWAAGEFTNQSREEVGGVKAMVERGDWFVEEGPANENERPAPADSFQPPGASAEDEGDKGRKSAPVVWSVFGLTHNPRVEDWPVMPVEMFQMHIKPVDFFTSNPAIDMPSTRNPTSVLVPHSDKHVVTAPAIEAKESTSATVPPGCCGTSTILPSHSPPGTTPLPVTTETSMQEPKTEVAAAAAVGVHLQSLGRDIDPKDLVLASEGKEKDKDDDAGSSEGGWEKIDNPA